MPHTPEQKRNERPVKPHTLDRRAEKAQQNAPCLGLGQLSRTDWTRRRKQTSLPGRARLHP
jgi:hypothetical protein